MLMWAPNKPVSGAYVFVSTDMIMNGMRCAGAERGRAAGGAAGGGEAAGAERRGCGPCASEDRARRRGRPYRQRAPACKGIAIIFRGSPFPRRAAFTEIYKLASVIASFAKLHHTAPK